MQLGPLRIPRLPRPPRPAHDRRQERSTSVGTALELALTQAARRAKLDALVMVDGRGMLVAKNRTELDVTMLAAVTPIVGQGRAVPRIRRQGRERGMSVRVFELDGEAFYMAAVGGEFIARQRELLSGATAAKRILA